MRGGRPRRWLEPLLAAAAAVAAGGTIVLFALLVVQNDGGRAPAASARPSTARESQPSEVALVEAGDDVMLPALDAHGQWGTITLRRGEDVGGYESAVPADLGGFENDPEAFYVEVYVRYEPGREPDPASFGDTDWQLRAASGGGSRELLIRSAHFTLPDRQAGLGQFPGAVDIFSTPAEGWLVFPVPRDAASATLELLYLPGGGDAIAATILVREPGPAPDPRAPIARPAEASYVAKPGLPFTVLENAAADELFADPDTCTNPEVGYTVTYPDSWYTNTEIGNVPPCSWFSAVFYEVADPSVAPDEIVIVFQYREGGGFGVIPEDARSVFHEELEVDGRQASRSESVGVAGAVLPLGSHVYEYSVTVEEMLPDDFNSGAILIASTSWEIDDDPEAYALNRAVLDRIMASLTFDR